MQQNKGIIQILCKFDIFWHTMEVEGTLLHPLYESRCIPKCKVPMADENIWRSVLLVILAAFWGSGLVASANYVLYILFPREHFKIRPGFSFERWIQRIQKLVFAAETANYYYDKYLHLVKTKEQRKDQLI